MTTIKATCPTCGEVSLTSEDVVLRVFPDGAHEDFYAFDCPDCAQQVRKPADARVVRLLRTGGVEPSEAVGHPERPPRGLPPISHDELLDFHELLQSDDWLDAAIGAFHQ